MPSGGEGLALGMGESSDMSVNSKTCDGTELLEILEQLPEGLLVVDDEGVVRFANNPGARLVKLKPKTAVGSVFAHAVEDGPMREFDVEMTVRPITWGGDSARLLLLKSLKGSGAFHLEWKLEAALERARAAEDALLELKAQHGQQASENGKPEVDVSGYEERIAELEQLWELAEQRADDLQNAIALDDHEHTTALQDALSQAREAEEQVRQLDAELEESRERVRVAEEQAEVAEERAYSLELELEQLVADREERETERDSLLAEIEDLRISVTTWRESVDRLTAELDQAEARQTELQERSGQAEEVGRQLEQAMSRIAELERERDGLLSRSSQSEEFHVQTLAELREQLEGKGRELTAALAEAEELREQRAVAVEESDELAEQLRAETEQFEERLGELEAHLRDARAESESLGKEREELSAECQALKKDVRRLENLLQNAEELAREGERVEKLERKLEGALRRAEEAEERLLEERRLLKEMKERKGPDVAEADSAETQRLAFQDELTGLPNRNILHRYLGFMLKQSSRHNRLTALLRIDCDGFKTIADTFGPETGDRLIRAVGERLSSVVRGTDVLGRYGEDEFVILLSELNDQDEATVMTASVIRRLQQKMRQPFSAGEQTVQIGVSVGVSLYPVDAHNGEQMFEHSAVALKRAKEMGGGQSQYFTPELQSRHEARNDLDNQLKAGLEQEQFEVLYQPIFDLANRQVIGLESLIRWNHPQHGVVEPESFLQVAEDSGMIVLIGNWALRQALERAAAWQRHGLGTFVSINLSKRQLLQADLVPTIDSALAEFGCSADRVLLEIPERLTAGEVARVRETLFELNRIGVRLAVDNFGTAATSLQDLRRGPFQVLKVDRKFVRSLSTSEENAGIVLSALTLGHHLGRITIAVGVEGETERQWLAKSGCRFAQGNFLSPPLSAGDVPNFVKQT